MREKSILFSGPMVRAILAGKKTQTRRVVKTRRENNTRVGRKAHQSHICSPEALNHCPYGLPGERLWVRETWAPIWNEYEPDVDQEIWDVPHYIDYRADSGAKYPGEWDDDMGDDPECPHWRPSIHMPRRASRITLEIVNVRVERVQGISDYDALAEGIDRTNTSLPGYATERFRKLWDSINAARGFGWDVNPWVWVIEFRRL